MILTALEKPFIWFPVERHCEQELVAGRLARHGAAIMMQYFNSTRESLAEKVISNLGKEVAIPPIFPNRAKKGSTYTSFCNSE